MEQTNPAVRYGTALEDPCPECGGKMTLRPSRYGPFYGCTNFPRCTCTHGAHPNGKPLGHPANKETRQARMQAHAAFDQLWKGESRIMSRNKAYKWLCYKVIHVGYGEAHIANLDIAGCQKVIQAVAKKMKTAGTP